MFQMTYNEKHEWEVSWANTGQMTQKFNEIQRVFLLARIFVCVTKIYNPYESCVLAKEKYDDWVCVWMCVSWNELTLHDHCALSIYVYFFHLNTSSNNNFSYLLYFSRAWVTFHLKLSEFQCVCVDTKMWTTYDKII